IGGRTEQYTSARLHTWRKFEFTYGRMEARIKVPAGRGIWPAFWALGDDAYGQGNWPTSGEIDAMEVIGSAPSELHGTLHGPWTRDSSGYAVGGIFAARAPLSDGFHTYTVDWIPGAVRFQLDGDTYAVRRTSDLPAGGSWTFDHQFFLLLDVA